MTLILAGLLVLFYFYIRKIWFHLRKIQTIASIEMIEVGIIQPDLVLPEVKLHYKYYFQGGVYYGYGYILLSEFLDGSDYEISITELGVIRLEWDGKVIVSEEHLEAFLLECYPSVFIYLDPIEPYKSRLEGLNKTSRIGVSSQ